MRNLTLSVIAVMAINTFAIAETYDAYGPNSYKALHDNDGSIESNKVGAAYVGLGYSYMNNGLTLKDYFTGDRLDSDIQGNALTLLAGYNVNEYFALEGRYSNTISDLSVDYSINEFDEGINLGGKMSNIAFYLKPKYTSDDITFYGLLGYGKLKLELDSIDILTESNFQWGLGLSFNAGKYLDKFFIDYIRLYDDSVGSLNQGFDTDLVVDTFNVGLTYKF